MRIALLGAGRIGQLHGRLVAEQPDVDEVIVYDVSPRTPRRPRRRSTAGSPPRSTRRSPPPTR